MVGGAEEALSKMDELVVEDLSVSQEDGEVGESEPNSKEPTQSSITEDEVRKEGEEESKEKGVPVVTSEENQIETTTEEQAVAADELTNSPANGPGVTTTPDVIPSEETRGADPATIVSEPVAKPEKVGDYIVQAILLSLPIDSLHSIASFLAPTEWANFGQCNKAANRVCQDIFRRVRLHGFRCATEVVTAWKFGQHADAKELCAVYIEAGVPIYPHSLGHSYHTLIWRMGIEAREMMGPPASEDTTESEDETANPRRRPVDRFYMERYDTRARDGFSFAQTYLEEKSIFLMNADNGNAEINSLASSMRRQISLTNNRLIIRPPPDVGDQVPPPPQPHGLRTHARVPSAGFATPPSGGLGRNLTRSNSQTDFRFRKPKTLIKIHRHLLDQHLLGWPSVDDNDGTMITPAISLSADFFHPHFSAKQHYSSHPERRVPLLNFASTDGFVSGELLPAWNEPVAQPRQAMYLTALTGTTLESSVTVGNRRRLSETTDDESESDSEPVISQLVDPVDGPLFEPQAAADAVDRMQQAPPPVYLDATMSQPLSSPAYPNVLSSIDLEVYSASSSAEPKMDTSNSAAREIRNHLRTRFAVYERRLEALLVRNDSVGFEECILDFWDEFLPQTANIHYYDRHTPVPRISCLHKFLSKPCPKAIGIVQCEIERIKLGSKKKGVNMKGRFFPTYEYRLFIRHRPADYQDGSEPSRRDAVLMMARNKGRKHSEGYGDASVSTNAKKGSNNYYLYLPQQDDVNNHYTSVNGSASPLQCVPNGASNLPTPRRGSVLLGRLQSNFIGTEFQIFTPRIKKKAPPLSNGRSPAAPVSSVESSDDELAGYDSGMSSDNASSSARRRSRFGRLKMRRSSTGTSIEQRTIVEGQSFEAENSPRRRLRRSRSSGEMPHGKRTSRRAIANTSDIQESPKPQPTLQEEEDGAITYTANLLGSRPRIMDVCIPRVSSSGQAGAEWKRYLDSMSSEVDGVPGNRMLNHLKQLQQRMENDEGGPVPNQPDTGTGDDRSAPPGDFGLLALQNRPPWWNIELGSFVLNFGGRVSVASVKNFQLCDRNDQEYIMLQFGRIQGRHSFTMDFQHPLTAVQAFAIAISSLQSKISFG